MSATESRSRTIRLSAIVPRTGRLQIPDLLSGCRFIIRVSFRKVQLLRMVGAYFEHDKTFLLPSAMEGIRKVADIYEGSPEGQLLIVGHTDTTGSKAYNRELSLARVRSMAAYLRDDVDAWLQAYKDKSDSRRWGQNEDELMLATVPVDDPFFKAGESFEDAVERFQEARGLKPDGICGPKTRRVLITEYMSIDRTTLPDGIEVVVHGCGEDFPDEQTGDNTASEKNRRVELFLFPDKVDPMPPSNTSKAGDPYYAEWKSQVRETIDFTDEMSDRVRVKLYDDEGNPMAHAPFSASFGNRPAEKGTSDSSGLAELTPPPVCPEMLNIGWGIGQNSEHEYYREIFVDCSIGDTTGKATLRLYNLGYPSKFDLEFSVKQFQRDHEVDCSPEPTGLIDGKIPEATRGKIDELFKR